MMKTKRVLCAVCVLVLVLAAFYPISASSLTLQEEWDAQKYSYTNPDTGYQAKVSDKYKLLTEDEGKSLLDQMIPLTEYGNVGFCTYEQSEYGFENEVNERTREARKELFGEGSNGSVYVIGKKDGQDHPFSNTSEKRAALSCGGTIAKYINYRKSEEITSGVEHYVEDDQYYSAASEVFRRMADITAEGVENEPIRYFSYAAIALVLGLIFAITLSFLTKFNPGMRETDDRLNVPSQKPSLKITKNHLIFKRRIDSIDD